MLFVVKISNMGVIFYPPLILPNLVLLRYLMYHIISSYFFILIFHEYVDQKLGDNHSKYYSNLMQLPEKTENRILEIKVNPC